MLVSIFLYSAIIGGMFLAVQLAMTFIGGDDGGDIGDMGDFDGLDGDVSKEGHGHTTASMFFEIFSLKTLAAAVTFFGLVGMAVLRSGGTETQSLASGVIAGAAALYGVFHLYKQLYRLQSSGNQDIRNSIGLPATVYIPIPAGKDGKGKVQMKMQGRIVEYQAVSEESEKLATGTDVYVVDIVNAQTLLVSRSLSEATEPSA